MGNRVAVREVLQNLAYLLFRMLHFSTMNYDLYSEGGKWKKISIHTHGFTQLPTGLCDLLEFFTWVLKIEPVKESAFSSYQGQSGNRAHCHPAEVCPPVNNSFCIIWVIYSEMSWPDI